MVRERSKNGAPGIPLVVLAILWAGALVWVFYLGAQAAQRREMQRLRRVAEAGDGDACISHCGEQR